MYDIPLKPFHEWKADQLREDYPLVRESDWYYREYGAYCTRERHRALMNQRERRGNMRR